MYIQCLTGVVMQTTIRRWGNSAGAILPASLLKDVGLSVGESVEIEVVGNTLVLRPAAPQYTLDELLAASPKHTMRPEQDDREWLESSVGEEW